MTSFAALRERAEQLSAPGGPTCCATAQLCMLVLGLYRVSHSALNATRMACHIIVRCMLHAFWSLSSACGMRVSYTRSIISFTCSTPHTSAIARRKRVLRIVRRALCVLHG